MPNPPQPDREESGAAKKSSVFTPATTVSLCVLLVILGFALFTPRRSSGVLKIELPPETGSFKQTPGFESANGQCLTCHSVEYVQMQPVKPRDFWVAVVKKMREKFGAQIPDNQVEPIVNYLANNYGLVTNQPAVAPTPTPVPTTVATEDAQSLAGRFGCLGCHNVSVKIVGPAYKDVAAKYHNDPQAFDKIAEQIHHGGSGKWGPVIMPPFPMVTEAETKTLATWILSQYSAQ